MPPNQFTDSAFGGVHGKPQPISPATFIDANRWRVTPQDVARRFAERDQRIALDTRTEAQKYLGDPPPDRSALAQRTRAAGS
jgi:hypothetical protein